ncbi:MAG: sigma-70 family RNA polymerase sigma factor [Planctomycetes bacterium]|nr:sigma-70 family RNA polymerase sigma factor [Planctomycetota bacterium]MBI3844054.1 sigma-70 family RNA polymerase sigma factor [Planctomycetota bacterium]
MQIMPDVRSLLSHADFVHAVASRLVAGADLADDLAQDAWLVAIQHPPKNDASPRGWLSAVLRNLARRRHHDEQRRSRHEEAASRPEFTASAEEVVQREAARRDVVDSILGLEEPYRTVVLLRFYENLKPREIAERLGVPVETVRTRLKRASDRLRSHLDDRYGSRDGWIIAVTPLTWARRSAAHAGIGTAMRAAWRVIASMSTAARTAVAISVAVILAVVAYVAFHREPPVALVSPQSTQVADLPSRHSMRDAPSMHSTPPPAIGPVVSAPKSRRVGDAPVAPTVTRGIVRGCVVDGNGNPVAPVDVGLGEIDSQNPCKLQNVAWTHTDDGRFEFHGKTQGAYRLVVNKESLPPGYLPPWHQEEASRASDPEMFPKGFYPTDVSVPDSADPVVADLHVFRAAMVTGRVVGLEGEGLAGIGVRVTSILPWFQQLCSDFITDVNGDFAMREVYPSRYRTMVGLVGGNGSPKYATTSMPLPQDFDLAEGDAKELRLHLGSGDRRVSGRVVGETGDPVANLAVLFQLGADWHVDGHVDDYASRVGIALTDLEGRFEMNRLASEPIVLLIEPEGYLTDRVGGVPRPRVPLEPIAIDLAHREGDVDIGTITAPLGPEFVYRGTIVLDADWAVANPCPLDALQVTVHSTDEKKRTTHESSGDRVSVRKDGAFVFRCDATWDPLELVVHCDVGKVKDKAISIHPRRGTEDAEISFP